MLPKFKIKQLKDILDYLNDPLLRYRKGVISALYNHYTEEETQKTFIRLIECIQELGFEGELFIELNFIIKRRVIKYTEEFYVLQYAHNKSLTNDESRSGRPRCIIQH